MNSRYSSRLCPVSNSTSRAAPDSSARHGARGSTSPSTTGENGVSVSRTAPQRGNSFIRAATAICASTRRIGSVWLSASKLGATPAAAAIASVMSAASARAEDRPRHALRDRPPEQAAGLVHREQRGDHAGAGRLAEHGHVRRVAAEPLDVVPHPAQRRHRVEQAAVRRGAGDLREPLHAQPVVAGDEDRPGPREPAAVVAIVGRRAEQVRAAVNPDEHRQRPGGRRPASTRSG